MIKKNLTSITNSKEDRLPYWFYSLPYAKKLLLDYLPKHVEEQAFHFSKCVRNGNCGGTRDRFLFCQ